ncbi:bifunctional 3'-5' exonuclease/DNA polymerase [Microbacterium sp. CBS5P-1]|nr:bifunctional 3'-5' exonuclease/DNA polymerase [Microbacterium excoecariae]
MRCDPRANGRVRPVTGDPGSPWPGKRDVVALGRAGEGWAAIVLAGSAPGTRWDLDAGAWASWVAEVERGGGPRWVCADAKATAALLLGEGVRLARCYDLRLAHDILARSVPGGPVSGPAPRPRADTPGALFELDAEGPDPGDAVEVARAWERQQRALAGAANADRLRLLLAAESAGALVAADMEAAGLPWDRAHHERILDAELGAADASGMPARMAQRARDVRRALGREALVLDSPGQVLAALQAAGVPVRSTSRGELVEHDHPAIPPLLAYKKLARLHTANGREWLAAWAPAGRFRPEYVPAGVVTGRWASSGGGALQIPRLLRPAVRADPGWRIVAADVAQLEPRVLAAMARDEAMASAARGADLYAGLVARGVAATRAEAKVAMLGALYGATSGDAGRLVPRLRRTFGRAMHVVDAAARAGERGEQVATWLGRTSPDPGAAWRALQDEAAAEGAPEAVRDAARRAAREQGRFTRNFVVQGTAAEWALAWLADLRIRLAQIPPVDPDRAGTGSGPAFSRVPHIAFFLHDEVILHVPAERADAAARAVRDAAEAAGRLLFGAFPLDFPLDLAVREDAAKE